jgi:D-alanine--D-alanine ligase
MTSAQPTVSLSAPDGQRINLIVIFGGQSAEHDVSRTTATHVLRAVDPARYNITPIGIDRDGRWSLADGVLHALAAGPAALPDQLDTSGTAVSPTEVVGAHAGPTVVIPLLHGPLGEDGTVQGLLELAGVPYVGSGVLGSALAMDKVMAKQVAAANGIPQAAYRAFRANEVTPNLPGEVADQLGLPLFVKPANMGSSVGVSKAKTVDDVAAAIEVALSYDEWVVAEEAITGREIEVAVLGNLDPQASLPGEVVPGAEFYDYADKYLDGESQTLIPAPLTNKERATVQALALRAFTALRCEGMARCDFFYDDRPGGRGWLFNEVNTIPGFTPISMYPKMWIASGVSYPELIDRLVELAIERHARRRRNTAH